MLSSPTFDRLWQARTAPDTGVRSLYRRTSAQPDFRRVRHDIAAAALDVASLGRRPLMDSATTIRLPAVEDHDVVLGLADKFDVRISARSRGLHDDQQQTGHHHLGRVPITTHSTAGGGNSDDTGGRNLSGSEWVPTVSDKALEVRRLRDRKDGRRAHRTVLKPCALREAAARRCAGSGEARCDAGNRRSPPTRRKYVEKPLMLPLPDMRLTSVDWRQGNLQTCPAGKPPSTRPGWSIRPRARHRVGAHAVARDAAGGVGGAGPREPPLVRVC